MSDILQLSNDQTILYTNFYDTICNVMKEFYYHNKDKTFSVLLSGGYDSRFVLYMCKDIGIPIKCCYTYSLNDRLSTDAKLASAVCEVESVECKVVNVPIDDITVIHTMEMLAEKYNCRKKVEFECTYPLYFLYKAINEDVVLTGTDSDNYFGLGLKYALHFKTLDDGLTKFKNTLFGPIRVSKLKGESIDVSKYKEPNDGQWLQRIQLSKDFNKISFDPFNTSEVYESLENTTWKELNEPYKKGPLYIQFKDKYDAIKPYRSSYQCGDSGVREMCRDVLLKSQYNNNFKSVIGCYNEIVRRLHNDNYTATLF